MQEFFKRFNLYAEQHADEYASQQPFSHAVIDNIFPDEILDQILAEFPSKDNPIWQNTHDAGIQVKQRTNWKSLFDIEPATREFVGLMNSGDFLRPLSRLTNISHLVSDPYFTGGGLNNTLPGGQLALHCDGNWHDDMSVHRRLNTIVFLNRNWQDDWGGQLELWDKNLQNCVKSIAPVFNRMVIFTTHDFTYHGHPHPLECPKGNSRKSVIFYYYTSESRPESQINYKETTFNNGVHRALWKKTADLDK